MMVNFSVSNSCQDEARYPLRPCCRRCRLCPRPNWKATTALNGAFDNEIGAASAELGCWDPLGFVTNGDQARFDRLRGIELKHGRIAMLATWGYATTWSGARFPGCEDVAAGHGKFFSGLFYRS